MKRWHRIIIAVLVSLLIVVLIGPFLIPVPPLESPLNEKELAEPGSKFIDVNDVTIHYQESGAGERTFILLHGFGASVFSWREVMDDLSSFGRVIAYDRPAFGLTERPMPETWTENPYGMQANIELLRGLMIALGVEKAVLVGNSAGGGVAVAFALEYPRMVESLVLVDPGVGGGRGVQFPAWALPLMWTPQMRHLGPLFMRDYEQTLPNTIRREWSDQTRLTDAILSRQLEILQIKNWDRAFYELTFAPAYPELRPLLPNLSMPVFIIAGREDRLIRPFYFEAISKEIPNAKLMLIPNCGHVPQEECPQAFMQAVENFLRLK